MGAAAERHGGSARGRGRHHPDLQDGGRPPAAPGAVAGERPDRRRSVRAQRGRRDREQARLAVGGEEGPGRAVHLPGG